MSAAGRRSLLAVGPWDGAGTRVAALLPAFLPVVLALMLVLAGCAGGARAPDWQVEARASAQRFADAYLQGERAQEAEFKRLHSALARTAEVARMGRAELLRCALQVASLDWPDRCEGFEPWRSQASAEDAAYADYLLGRWSPASAQALPLPQRRVALQGAGALAGLEDPLSRLVGAAVMLRSGRVPVAEQGALVALAVDTASAQGWRRPLLAWLLLQRDRARAQGLQQEVERIDLRLRVLELRP